MPDGNVFDPTQEVANAQKNNFAADVVKANPSLAYNPAMVHSLMQGNAANGQEAGNSSNFISAADAITHHATNQVESGGSGAGFWGHLWHSAANIADGIRHEIANTYDITRHTVASLGNVGQDLTGAADIVSNLGQRLTQRSTWDALANAPMNIGEGAIQGTADTLKTAWDVADRTALTIGEIASGGHLGPGWKMDGGGLDDIRNTIEHLASGAVNSFQIMSHSWAFVQSLAAAHGWDYAIGYLAPAIISGVATDGATAAADGAAMGSEVAAAATEAGSVVADGVTAGAEPIETAAAAASTGGDAIKTVKGLEAPQTFDELSSAEKASVIKDALAAEGLPPQGPPEWDAKYVKEEAEIKGHPISWGKAKSLVTEAKNEFGAEVSKNYSMDYAQTVKDPSFPESAQIPNLYKRLSSRIRGEAHTEAQFHYENLTLAERDHVDAEFASLNKMPVEMLKGMTEKERAAFRKEAADQYNKDVLSHHKIIQETNDVPKLTRGDKNLYRRLHATTISKDTYQNENLVNTMSRLRSGASTVSNIISKPAKPLLAGARKITSPMTSPKMLTIYGVLSQTAQGDPESRALWEKTANGVAYDAYGKPLGTDGQMLAQYLGMSKDNPFFSPVSGLTDFYTKWMGVDPFQAVGKVIGTARSYNGFSGLLGNWYRGLGVRNGQDVYNAYDHYKRVRNAVDLIATQSRPQIAATFRNTFSPQLLSKLADAHTSEDVLKILADVGDGKGLLDGMMPTLSMRQVLGAKVLDGGGRDWLAGEVLASDIKVMQTMKTAQAENRIIDISGDGAFYSANNDVAMRANYTFRNFMHTLHLEDLRKAIAAKEYGRWAVSKLAKMPMYWSEDHSAWQNIEIELLNPNAVPAIMDQMRRMHLPTDLINSTGDFLLKSNNAKEWANCISNIMYHSVMRKAVAGINKSTMDGLVVQITKHINEKVLETMGHYGGGTTGEYVAGERGVEKSKIIPQGSSDVKRAGIGTSHEGVFHFPDPRKLDSLAQQINATLITVAGISDNASILRNWDQASQEVIQKLADYHEANLKGLSSHFEWTEASSKESLSKLHTSEKLQNLAHRAYDNIVGRLDNMYKQMLNDPLITPGGAFSPIETKRVEQMAFVKMFESVHASLKAVRLELQSVSTGSADLRLEIAQRAVSDPSSLTPEEWVMMWSVKTSDAEQVAKWNGEEHALADAAHHLNSIIEESNFSINDIKKYALDYAETLGNNKNQIDSLSDHFVNALNKAKNKHGNYLNKYQITADNINRYLSLVFVPLSLLSGGWALRVAASEGILNTIRAGGWDSFDAKIAASIARHELRGRRMIDVNMTKKADRETAMTMRRQAMTRAEEESAKLRAMNRYLSEANMTRPEFYALPPKDQRVIHEAVEQLMYDQPIARGVVSEKLYVKDTVAKALYSLYQGSRDVMGGTLLGIEKNLLVGMSKEEKDRMVDNFASVIMRHDAHLPGEIHGNDTLMDDGNMESALKKIHYGVDENGRYSVGRSSRTGGFTQISQGRTYVTALHENLTRIASDELMYQVASRMRELQMDRYARRFEQVLRERKLKYSDIDAMPEEEQKAFLQQIKDESKTLPDALPRQMGQREAEKIWMPELEKAALEAIEKMSPAERAKFERDTALSAIDSTGDPHKDWANALAYHVLNSFKGTGPEGDIVYRELLDQVFKQSIKEPSDLFWDVKKMGHAAPSHLPVRGFKEVSWKDELKSKNLIAKISDVGHDKVLGKIVNSMVRDPIFLYEYHKAMEEIRPFVQAGHMSETEAEVLADTRASIRMSKYVHNPKDKAVFEANMRTVAPFYFAKNQAWRRAFRVMHSDPGAFFRYLKVCMAITDYMGSGASSGLTNNMTLPGSALMSFAANQANILGRSNSAYSNLNFGMSANVGSVQSIDPLGVEKTPWGMIGEFVRPPWGPAVTVPAKVVDALFGRQSEAYNNFFNALLGPVASQIDPYSQSWKGIAGGIAQDLLPSSVGRNVYNMVFNGPSIQATQNLVLNNAFDNLFATTYQKNWDNNSKVNPAFWNRYNYNQKETFVRGQTDVEIGRLFRDHNFATQFMMNAHTSAVAMFSVKTLLGFFSPVSIEILNSFSSQPDYQKIALMKDPTTGKQISTQEAMSMFTMMHPTKILDLVAHSKGDFTSYPETKEAIDFIKKNPISVRQYAYGSAFLINRTGAYDPMAFQLEAYMGLRKHEAPQDYINSLMTAIGDDYYFNYLPQQFPNANKRGSVGSKARKEMAFEAQSYGVNYNPTWYASFAGKDSYSVASLALQEMKAMLKDKTYTAWPSTLDKLKFNYLVNQYDLITTLIDNAMSKGLTSLAARRQAEWYDMCTAWSQAPGYSLQSYFITSVLRKLPTKQE